VGSVLFAWIASYIPSLMPEEYTLRVAVNLELDLIFAVSLFVLGGDFWASCERFSSTRPRAVFPPAAST